MEPWRTMIRHSRIMEIIALLMKWLKGDLQDELPAVTVCEHWMYKYLSLEPSLRSVAGECLMHLEERDDVAEMARQIKAMSRSTKQYILLAKTLSLEEHLAMYREQSRIVEAVVKRGIKDEAAFFKHYQNPDPFFEGLSELLERVSASRALTVLESPEALKTIEKRLAAIRANLEHCHPLSVSQSLMGKNFYNTSEWSVYEFVVSYLVDEPLLFRAVDRGCQVLVVGCEKNDPQLADQLEMIHQMLKILSDPTRLEIIGMIYGQAMSGKGIAEALSLKGPTVSHHLALMREISLIREERDGNTKYFSINRSTYVWLMRAIDQYITGTQHI